MKARLFGDPDAPARMGRFIVLGALGSGGMGSVLRAYDETLDRQVAVKLMHPGVHEEHDRRMLREAQALARLSHPNVVQVYEVGEVDGRLFIAMELVAGQTLERWQGSPRPWRQCLEVYVQAGRGLAAAHAAGMIHRDFKPSNCIMDEAGRVRVLDFGLARHTEPAESDEPGEDPEPAASPARSASALDEQLTSPGSVLGTIAYMAPEQMYGHEIDARADQYAFCVSLYEALFGERPWLRRVGGEQSSISGVRLQIPSSTPSSHHVPRWLMRALDRGLANDPAARWPAMDVLLDALERHQRRRSAGWLGAGVAVVGLAVAGVVLAGDEARTSAPPDPCHDAAHAVLQAWNDGERVRVREAILSSELAFAPQTWASVESQLGGYAEGLGAAYVEACETTMVRHEQTRDDLGLRNACLDERVGALRQTLSILAGADAEVVENAVEKMMVALPGPEPCAEVEVLRRAAAGADDVQGSEPLRERLREARALTTAGKRSEGLAVVEPVVVQAEALGAAVLLAEARLVEGTLRAKLGQHEPAAQVLQLALAGAIEHGADAVAMEALTELIYLVGVEQAKVGAGAWLAAIAEAFVGRAQADGAAQARVLTAVAQLSSARGEHGDAQTRLERALGLLQRSVGEDHIALAEPLDTLGLALRNQGKLEAALRQYQRALDIRIRWQGPLHPSTVHLRINLGVGLDEQGAYEGAQRQYQEALGILAASPGEHRKLVAHAVTALAASLGKQGRYGEAARELPVAIAEWVAVHGPEHPRVARALLSLAGVLRADGRHEEAVEQYESALVVLRSSEPTPANDAMVLTALDGLVESLESLGRDDDAKARRAELERLATVGP